MAGEKWQIDYISEVMFCATDPYTVYIMMLTVTLLYILRERMLHE